MPMQAGYPGVGLVELVGGQDSRRKTAAAGTHLSSSGWELRCNMLLALPFDGSSFRESVCADAILDANLPTPSYILVGCAPILKAFWSNKPVLSPGAHIVGPL